MLWTRRWPLNRCAAVAPCPWEGVEVNPVSRLDSVWLWGQVQLSANSSCCLLGPSSQPELLHGSHLRSLHHGHHSGPYAAGSGCRGAEGALGLCTSLGVGMVWKKLGIHNWMGPWHVTSARYTGATTSWLGCR